jgi:hypothetical protein
MKTSKRAFDHPLPGGTLEDSEAALLNVALGLKSLCGHLLVRRENEKGIPAAQTLQDLGARYAN